jgi:hypothetical protein
MKRIESTAFEDFHGGQLVVDLPYLDMVLRRLGVELGTAGTAGTAGAPAGIPGVVSNKDLDLALITVDQASLENTAEELRKDADFFRVFLDEQPAVYKTAARKVNAVPDLDLLLFRVQKRFADEFAGWSPAMDKNHVATAIEGTPGISGGGEGAPKEADRQSFEQTVFRPPQAGAGAPVTIGLLDTPIFEGHELFGNVLTRVVDRLSLAEQPIPQSAGHCTFVAGMIMARAPRSTLIVRAVLSRERATAFLWDTAEAMVELGRKRVDLMNVSWIYNTASLAPSLILDRTLEKVRDLSPGVVLVAAAGNHGLPPDRRSAPGNGAEREPLPPNRPVHPAATPGVIAVGAFKKGADPAKPEPAEFSPQPAPWISLGAPGEDVVSTYIKGLVHVRAREREAGASGHDVRFEREFARWSGTSFATGYVTGEIARLMEMEGLTAQAAVRKLLRGIPGSAVQPYAREDQSQPRQ